MNKEIAIEQSPIFCDGVCQLTSVNPVGMVFFVELYLKVFHHTMKYEKQRNTGQDPL